jgi:hypothetical protein
MQKSSLLVNHVILSSEKMLRLLVPVDAQQRTKKTSRSEELQSKKCTTDHDSSSISEFSDESIEAVTLRKKIKLSKTECQIQNESTARQLISEFEDIALVSSSDSESTLSIDDDADSLIDAPSTLVWAPIKGKGGSSIMWPSQVIDQALIPDGKVSGCPPCIAERHILVQYLNRDKLGWINKSQLKLFRENQRGSPKDSTMSARLRQAVNKARRMLKMEEADIANRLSSSLEVRDNVEAHETDKRSKVKIVKARKMEGGKPPTKRIGKLSSTKLKGKISRATRTISDATFLQKMDEKIVDSSSLKMEKRQLKAIKSEPEMTNQATKAKKKVSWEQSSASEEPKMESFLVSDFDISFKISRVRLLKSHIIEQHHLLQTVLEKLKNTVHKYEAGDGHKPTSVRKSAC